MASPIKILSTFIYVYRERSEQFIFQYFILRHFTSLIRFVGERNFFQFIVCLHNFLLQFLFVTG